MDTDDQLSTYHRFSVTLVPRAGKPTEHRVTGRNPLDAVNRARCALAADVARTIVDGCAHSGWDRDAHVDPCGYIRVAVVGARLVVTDRT